MRWFVTIGLLVLMTVLGAACSRAGTTPTATITPLPKATSTPEPKATPIPTAEPTATLTPIPEPITLPTVPSTPTAESTSVYEELLGLIPDTPWTREEVWINDYARMRELYDMPLPPADADDEAMTQYLDKFYPKNPVLYPHLPRMGLPPFISGYPSIFRYPRPIIVVRRQYLGFDVRNVDQSVLAGREQGILEVVAGREQGILEVVRGGFDPKTTEEALEACSECPSALREQHRGVSFYSWGEDFVEDSTKFRGPPAYDFAGRGGRIAVQDNYVFRTVWTEGMKALIDASQGRRATLADVEDFRLLAKGMTDLEAYATVLSDWTPGFGNIETWMFGEIGSQNLMTAEIKVVGDLSMTPLLRPYISFASGQGKYERGPYMALTLVHSDATSAEENVALLRRRIEETGSFWRGDLWIDMVDSMEITAEGRVLSAKLWGDIAVVWIRWIDERDPLLLHE